MTPTPEQIAASIHRVHQARREAWPPPDEFMQAQIEPLQLLAWAAGWSGMRTKWMDTVEDLIERFPLAESVSELAYLEQQLIGEFTESATNFRLDMMALLDG